MKYSFMCSNCKQTYEITMSISAYSIPNKCNVCKKRCNQKRIYNPVAIIFNDSGFTKHNREGDRL
jgi:predicted nucleic acid-binding Zn ribbon protein